MIRQSFALILFTFFYALTIGCQFFPENNLKIPISDKNDGLSESQYHEVINKVVNTYSEIAASYGAKILVDRRWKSETVNAGTYRSGKNWRINLYGGFARHPFITTDGYALVICHEIGHHIGGAPKKNISKPSWATAEGQADYFATLKCLRKVFRADDNIAIIKTMQVPSIVKEKCYDHFEEEWEKALCVRTTLAGHAVQKIGASLNGRPMPQFETPEETLALKTNLSYPVPQCRLDTYFMGSVCEVASNIKVSQSDETIGTCHSKSGHSEGLRPACWFKESP